MKTRPPLAGVKTDELLSHIVESMGVQSWTLTGEVFKEATPS
jgi:hypothetical protein